MNWDVIIISDNMAPIYLQQITNVTNQSIWFILQLVGNQFVLAIKPHFDNQWTPEIEDAWVQLFKVMTYHMKKGLIDAPVITY